MHDWMQRTYKTDPIQKLTLRIVPPSWAKSSWLCTTIAYTNFNTHPQRELGFAATVGCSCTHSTESWVKICKHNIQILVIGRRWRPLSWPIHPLTTLKADCFRSPPGRTSFVSSLAVGSITLGSSVVVDGLNRWPLVELGLDRGFLLCETAEVTPCVSLVG